MAGENLAQALPFKDTQRYRSERLNRVLHFAFHRPLQSQQVAGQGEVEDLPPSVFQRLVTERPTAQQCEQMSAMRPLDENAGACIGAQLARLEA